MAPWLTVATVVKDDATGFVRTWESIAAQSLDSVELVVIDSSADAEAVPGVMRDRSVNAEVQYEWTPPAGVYPAMNRALDKGSGRFIHFLNAGDEFAESTTVTRLRALLDGTDAAWAFGPVEIIEASGHAVITPPWDYPAERRRLFSRGHFPPHQGTVVDRLLLRQVGGFDTRFRISADYAAFLRLSKVADPLIVPFVVARFHEGGLSTASWRQSFREFHRARREILQPHGAQAVREQVDTLRHLALVYAHRELRPRLGLRRRSSA